MQGRTDTLQPHVCEVPMWTPPAHADAHRRVTAPGGYEWWYFDAESADGTRIVAIVFDGYVFHSGYLRRYAAWRRNPTRTAPPVASDYPAAYLVLYKEGRVWRQCLTGYAPGSFRASRDVLDVRIGEDVRVEGVEDGVRVQIAGVPWRVTGRGPRSIEGEHLACDLTFSATSRADVGERVFLSRGMTGADHGWVPAMPTCRVTGTAGLAGDAFAGRGYHDHNYGTGPLGPGLRRWAWGRVLTEAGVVSFHAAEPTDGALPPEQHAWRIDGEGWRDVSGLSVDWSRRSRTWLSFPRHIHADGLRLTDARVIDDSPFYLRVTYTSEVDGRPAADALVEVGHPRRLRWPVLGRMIEISIDKRP